MSVRTRIALGTLCSFNAITLVVIGFVSLLFVDGASGPVGAALFWLGGGALLALARRLRRETDWA